MAIAEPASSTKGFTPSQNPLDPAGLKDVQWPRDVVCTLNVSCSCESAPVDPNIITPCSDGAETPDLVVRRTVVFDSTLTCDNVGHPQYPNGGLSDENPESQNGGGQ